jgi:hypothetical protein
LCFCRQAPTALDRGETASGAHFPILSSPSYSLVAVGHYSKPDQTNKKALQRPLAMALGFLGNLKKAGGWKDDELWNLADMYADDTNALVKVRRPSFHISISDTEGEEEKLLASSRSS